MELVEHDLPWKMNAWPSALNLPSLDMKLGGTDGLNGENLKILIEYCLRFAFESSFYNYYLFLLWRIIGTTSKVILINWSKILVLYPILKQCGDKPYAEDRTKCQSKHAKKDTEADQGVG